MNIYDQKRKILRKEVRPKYTKINSVNRNFKVRDRNGIHICNILVNAIKIQRECDKSNDMGIEMKSRYAKLAGKFDDNVKDHSDNTDTYYSDGDDLEAYNRFAGRF